MESEALLAFRELYGKEEKLKQSKRNLIVN